MRRLPWLASLALMLLAAGPASAQLFIGLGDLPGSTFGSRAFGVSANGRVVAGYSSSELAPEREPFRWTAAGMQGLGLLPGAFFATCNGVSPDGSAIVGEMVGASSQAYRWTLATGLEGLGVLAGDSSSEALAASDGGAVVVGESQDPLGPRHAFRWSEGAGMQPLGFLAGGDRSVAQGVSADGDVVVGYGSSSNGANEAFRWTASESVPPPLPQGLGDLADGGFSSAATSISADGLVVVGAGESAAGQNAIRVTAADGMTSLGNPHAVAYAASGDGSLIVGEADFLLGPTDEAFLWDAAHGMRRLATVLVNDLHLDLSDWSLGPARGISADGNTIVGWGTHTDGRVEAWLARLPEPDAAASQAAAVAALAALARSAHRRSRR